MNGNNEIREMMKMNKNWIWKRFHKSCGKRINKNENNEIYLLLQNKNESSIIIKYLNNKFNEIHINKLKLNNVNIHLIK